MENSPNENPPQTEAPDTTKKTSATLSESERTRRQTIALILTKVRVACSLPALSPKEFKLQLPTWIEALELINPHWLDRCYLRAIRVHKGDRPFGVYDIVAQWRDANASGEVEAWVQAGGRALPRPDCKLCSNTGWQPAMLNAEDSPVKRCECRR